MTTALPILRLTGDPRTMGQVHGLQAKDLIQHNLEVYFRRFEKEACLTREHVADRAGKYLKVIEQTNGEYAAAMRGVAAGSGFDLIDIVALNARYELLYSQFVQQGLDELASGKTDGCTAFAVMPMVTADGHLYLGQNWDWIPDAAGVLLNIETPNGHRILCFTEAGIVGGKIGLNSSGLGLVINGMFSHLDSWDRLGKPFHVSCWEILNSRTLDEAVSAVKDARRSCSANFLVGHAHSRRQAEVIDIEAAPDRICTWKPQNGSLAHANHFTDPAALGVYQPLREDRQSTFHRCARMQQLLTQATSEKQVALEDLKSVLRDHDEYPDSICRHPNDTFPVDERYQTVVSVILDLHGRRLWACPGVPCRGDYAELMLI